MHINIRKMLTGAVMTAALCAMPFTAFASTKKSVSSVKMTIEGDFELDGDSYDVNIDTSASTYSVDGYRLSSTIPSNGWQTNSHPIIVVTLSLEDPDEYKWSVSSTSKVSVSGDSGSVTSVSKSGNYLNVTFKFGSLSGSSSSDSDDYDLTVDDLSWDEESGTAYWEGGNDAKKYEVKLYRSGTLIKTVTTTSDHYCFASSFTQSGTYRFKVRAIYSSSKKGTTETSENFSVTSTEASTIKSEYGGTTNSGSTVTSSSSGPGGSSVDTGSTSGPSNISYGQWIQDNVGWWYRNSDGSYTTSNWQYINGQWYYFWESGYMATGWVYVDGYWYYLDAVNGNMYASRMTPDGYYVTASGAWIQ